MALGDGKAFPLTGERGLLGAILARAVYDALGSRTGNQCHKDDCPEQTDAITWLFSNNRGRWSFLWVCAHLGFSPSCIRASYHRSLVRRRN